MDKVTTIFAFHIIIKKKKIIGRKYKGVILIKNKSNGQNICYEYNKKQRNTRNNALYQLRLNSDNIPEAQTTQLDNFVFSMGYNH